MDFTVVKEYNEGYLTSFCVDSVRHLVGDVGNCASDVSLQNNTMFVRDSYQSDKSGMLTSSSKNSAQVSGSNAPMTIAIPSSAKAVARSPMFVLSLLGEESQLIERMVDYRLGLHVDVTLIKGNIAVQLVYECLVGLGDTVE